MSALVNSETGELIEPMDTETARRLTERIRIAAANYTEAKAKVLALVDEAKAGHAHLALGYKSWTAYLSDVLSDEPLRLAREERRELTVRLADEGMSSRAIAPIVGASYDTVQRDIRTSTDRDLSVDERPPTIVRTTTGLDGKERTTVIAGPPVQPRRKALTDSFWTAVYDLGKRMESVHRLTEDDRWAQNAEKVAAAHRNDLLRINDLLQQVINSLPTNEVTS